MSSRGAVGETIGDRGVAGRVVAQLAALGHPLDPAAVHQFQPAMAVVAEHPVGVSREPVVVVAVEDDGGLRQHSAAAEQGLECCAGGNVAHGLVLELALPVPPNGTANVARVIGGRVHVDLDQPRGGRAQVLGHPLGADDSLLVGVGVVCRHVPHRSPGPPPPPANYYVGGYVPPTGLSASATADRDSTPSLERTFSACFSTVRIETPRRSPIWRSVAPAAMSRATSASRRVRHAAAPGSLSAPATPRANSTASGSAIRWPRAWAEVATTT